MTVNRMIITKFHGDHHHLQAAALAAFCRQIAVAHIEAGFRIHNIYSPRLEKMNRQLTQRIAAYNLVPTPSIKRIC